MTDPLTAHWTAEQIAVMHHLRDWVVDFGELNQHLAAWLGLPGADANALGQIIWAAEADTPLSPARLSRQIGMTTGATAILLNRLETAGHIQRTRECADRRRVTLRPTQDARDRARQFLAVAGTEIAHVLRTTSPAELSTVATFLARMTAAADEANLRLQR
jgi:DNA-binding MarR family transcriptional regulator